MDTRPAGRDTRRCPSHVLTCNGTPRRNGRRRRRRLSRRRAAALVLLCIVPSLWISTIATARPPSEIAPLRPEAFRPIEVAPDPTGAVEAERDTIAVAPEPSLGPIRDFPASSHVPGSRALPVLENTVEAVITVAPTPRPKATSSTKTSAPRSAGHRVGGTATWYCKTGVSVCHHSYPGGMYAAAGSEIRVGDWRGRTVRVCAGGDCISVRLIDWCACGGARIIDLYSDAFRRLAPLSAGGIHVTVSW